MSFPPFALFACIFLMGCCSYGNQQKQVTPIAAEPDQYVTDRQNKSGIDLPADFHYVVQCTFTPTTLSPVSGARGTGVMSLIVTPTDDLFLAVYKGDTLIHYFKLADPLEKHAIAPQQGQQERLKEGSGVLLFPASFTAQYRKAQLDMGIYTVKTYLPDFAAELRTYQALQKARTEGKIAEVYRLDPGQILSFLDTL